MAKKRVERDCGNPKCEQTFLAYVGRDRYGEGKYCSRACSNTMRTKWNRATVTAALRHWTDEHGRVPFSTDFGRPGAGYPTEGRVRGVFGSWPAAILAAGLDCPARRGRELMQAMVKPGGRFVHAAFPTSLGAFCGEPLDELRVKAGDRPTCLECVRVAYAWNIDNSAPSSWFPQPAAA